MSRGTRHPAGAPRTAAAKVALSATGGAATLARRDPGERRAERIVVTKRPGAAMRPPRTAPRSRAAPGAGPAQARRTWPVWIAALGIAALTALAYAGVLDHEFVTWDDPAYVWENPLVQRRDARALLGAVVSSNYHPLTMLSLMLDVRPGLPAEPFLRTNLLLHVANTVLAFVLSFLLAGRRVVAAAITALVFGIHPMHVESVAWISERKDVLYGLFFLAAALAYWRYLERGRGAWLAGAFALFVLSCLAKGMAVAFPGVMALLDFWKGRPLLERRALLEKIPFVAVALFFGLVAINVQAGGDFHGLLTPLERNLKPLGRPEGVTPLEQLVLPTLGYSLYVLRLFVPVGLSAFHPYPDLEGRWPFLLAPVFFAATLAAAAWDARRTRVIAFGLGWFLVTIALVLQWIPVGSALMADRYTYLPYFGLGFALALGVARALEARRALGLALLAVTAVGAAAWLAATIRQVETWRNSDTLWGRVIELHPGHAQAYVNRANHRGRSGRLDEALADLRTARRLGSRQVELFLNLGNVHGRRGELDSALVQYGEALRLDPERGAARLNRALVLLHLGRAEEALADLARYEALMPLRAAALHAARGRAYRMLGRHAEAVAELDRAIAAGARRADVFLDRGLARAAQDDRGGAIADFREALRIDPGHAEARARIEELRGRP